MLRVSHLPTTLLSLLRALLCWAAGVAACHHYHCGEKKRKSTVLHTFITFCFCDDDSEFDGKVDGNNDGNGYRDESSLSLL
jgi:hypothetical protein